MSKLLDFFGSAFLTACLLIILGGLVLDSKLAPQAATAQPSAPNCQYPDRWSNPPGGCDNSDPAVPECIKEFSTKAGEDACIAALVAANQPKPIETVTPAQPVEAAQFGGK